MALCKHCGSPNEPGAKFCRKCGVQITEVEAPRGGSSYNYYRSGNQASGFFANAGGKLKALAIINFIMIILGGIGLCMYAFKLKSPGTGIIIVIAAALLGWLSSIKLYAYGELCENVHNIRYFAAQIESNTRNNDIK